MNYFYKYHDTYELRKKVILYYNGILLSYTLILKIIYNFLKYHYNDKKVYGYIN